MDLAHQEELISKRKAKELYEQGLLDIWEAGSTESLRKIHRYLFEDIYDLAGEIREVNPKFFHLTTRLKF